MVGGGWSKLRKFLRVLGGGEEGWLNILYKLGEESLVLLSSSNWDLLWLFLVAGNGGISEVVGGG